MKLTLMSFLDLTEQEQIAVVQERGHLMFKWACDEWGGIFFVLDDGFFLMFKHNLADDSVRLVPIGTKGPLYWALTVALDEAITLDDLGL